MEREPSQAVVMRFDDPSAHGAPEVVYLHGRGSSEREAARWLPAFRGATLRAYRGPLREGGGFSWFANQGIGIARPESIRAELPKVADWIAADNGARAPWLCGFSNGAAMAAGLALAAPSRYAGLVMIGGCFAHGEFPAGGLAGMPVLFCQGAEDRVIPPLKFKEASRYLLEESGADVEHIFYPGGHEADARLVGRVARWFAARR